MNKRNSGSSTENNDTESIQENENPVLNIQIRSDSLTPAQIAEQTRLFGPDQKRDESKLIS